MQSTVHLRKAYPYFDRLPESTGNTDKSRAQRSAVVSKDAKRLAIGADAKGVLRFQESEVDGDHVVLLVTERVSDNYLAQDRKSTRLNSSHMSISYAVFCLKKKKT